MEKLKIRNPIPMIQIQMTKTVGHWISVLSIEDVYCSLLYALGSLILLGAGSRCFFAGKGHKGRAGSLKGRGATLLEANYWPLTFSSCSCFVLHSMHRVVTGLALSRASEISSPQDSQMP